MLNVTNHQRNESKNHLTYHLTSVRMALTNKSTNNRSGEDMEIGEPFCTVGGGRHCGKQYGDT